MHSLFIRKKFSWFRQTCSAVFFFISGRLFDKSLSTAPKKLVAPLCIADRFPLTSRNAQSYNHDFFVDSQNCSQVVQCSIPKILNNSSDLCMSTFSLTILGSPVVRRSISILGEKLFKVFTSAFKSLQVCGLHYWWKRFRSTEARQSRGRTRKGNSQ